MAKKSKQKGTVITCYPVIQGNGSKYTATNLADVIKEQNPNLSVVLVDLDFKAPYLAGYISGHDQVHTIDNLIERINGDFLDEETIEENLVQLKNGVLLLKGTKLKNTHYFIKQEHIHHILTFLKKMFDVIVVAVSNGSDTLGTMVAFLQSDHIILVGKNDFSNYMSLQNEIKFVKNYAAKEHKIKLLFNQYNEASDLDFQSILEEEDIPLVGWVPFDPETIDNQYITNKRSIKRWFRSKNNGTPYDNVVSLILNEVDTSED